MQRDFGGVIWTDHALQRLKERNIKQGDAWAAWRRPDQSRRAGTDGAWIYYRTWGDEKIEVVAKKNDRGQWIILSVWSRPVYGDHKPSRKSRQNSLLERLLQKLLGRFRRSS